MLLTKWANTLFKSYQIHVEQRSLFGQFLRKWRRFIYGTFFADVVQKKIDSERKGECHRCGLCCELIYKCPFLGKDAENLPYCRIYGDLRPANCRIYPFDKTDSEIDQCGFSFDETPKKLKSVVVVGNFDGFHTGHQNILEVALQLARIRNLQLVVYTFNPHPQIFLNSLKSPKLIMPYAEKIRVIQQWLGDPIRALPEGRVKVVEQRFDQAFAERTARQFFDATLIEEWNAIDIVVGYDFCFGKAREGSIEKLREWCNEPRADGSKVKVTVVQAKEAFGSAVSSSRIRTLIEIGEVKKAEQLLGRPVSFSGRVIEGEKRGRQIGIPTANIALSDSLLCAKFGVYATRVVVYKNDQDTIPLFTWESAVSNLGLRPTFNQGENLANLETHLIGFVELTNEAGLYGKKIEVQLLERIRSEIQFQGETIEQKISLLKDQIQKDRDWAEKFHLERQKTLSPVS